MTIFTAGVWDLFHVGHLRFLQKSKALGDKLIVGVSTNELVKSYKGHEPLMPLNERIAIIQALECVDLAVTQRKLVGIELLKLCNPDIVTLGNDWIGKPIEGIEWFRKQGGTVFYLPYTQGVSTSGLAEKIRKEWP